jgi:hypothetical protein
MSNLKTSHPLMVAHLHDLSVYPPLENKSITNVGYFQTCTSLNSTDITSVKELRCEDR